MQKKLTLLVTGGAGFIGSHFVNLLRKETLYQILVVDNFSQGRENILKDDKIKYFEADLRDYNKLLEIFQDNSIDAVVHFAALATITGSVTDPSATYENNLVGGWNLLDCMLKAGVKKIIFSSSASVYGEPTAEVLSESHPKNPVNPYGFSKWCIERILQDYYRGYGLDSISFRYFCAAGANPNREAGEHHKPETHVIPCILETFLGRRKKFFVFGNDFPTPDGTGIRDYIHVEDLAAAHIAGLEKLMSSNICEAYNLGINKGFSVLELIAAAEKIVGKKLNYKIVGRRPGDPSRLVADASKANKELNWQPKYTNIEEMIQTSYNALRVRKGHT
jgi:UDP-glucose 4-epimerase